MNRQLEQMQIDSHDSAVPSQVGNAQSATSVPESPGGGRGTHAGGLLLVGLYKLSKTVFFAALGVGALHMIHHNLGELVMRLTEALRVDQEGHLVSLLMDRADLVGGHQLRQLSIFAFAYSALCLVEGLGLVLQKTWAEYFTTVLTALGLPWETYELVLRFNWYKVGLLLINAAVLLYLLWVLERKKAEARLAQAASDGKREPRVSP